MAFNAGEVHFSSAQQVVRDSGDLISREEPAEDHFSRSFIPRVVPRISEVVFEPIPNAPFTSVPPHRWWLSGRGRHIWDRGAFRYYGSLYHPARGRGHGRPF